MSSPGSRTFHTTPREQWHNKLAATHRAIVAQVQPRQQAHDALLLPVQPRVLHGHRQVVHGDLAVCIRVDEVEDLRGQAGAGRFTGLGPSWQGKAG